MEEIIISKTKINEFIQYVITNYSVFAPVRDKDIFLFKEIKKADEMNLEYDNSKIPPKSIFLPQTETLFKFYKNRDIELETPKKDKKTCVFGIRPCDAKSLKILDQVFTGEYEDSLYISRRKNSVLIGLTCHTPSLNCFCTSINGSPAGTDGLDVLLTDIGDRYYVDLITDKGKKFVENIPFFTPARKEDKKKKEKKVKKAKDSITRHIQCKNLVSHLDSMFDHDYWKEIAKKCLGCGICTFLCPTCHCFDMQDELAGDKGARVRVWDSCMYPEYTMQASGYNPRPHQTNRIRNRVFHKFNYLPKNNQVFGCVGCGRCITECPVNIDIIEVVNQAWEVTKR
jgi:ferredoxin